MYKIIALIDFKTKTDSIIQSAINLAGFGKWEIEICHLVEGPLDWEKLSRSTRDKYPESKRDLANVREKMDELLREIRALGIKVSKRIVMCDKKVESKLPYSSKDIVLIDSSNVSELIHMSCNLIDHIPENCPIFILSEVFDPIELNDLMLTSTFKGGLKEATSDILSLFIDKVDFHKHFLYINTKNKFEFTTVSVDKMKKLINDHCLGKTHISVFNAQNFIHGVKEFVEVKNCDLVLIEKFKMSDILSEYEINVPLFFIP